jgi:serine/threonine protein kinase
MARCTCSDINLDNLLFKSANPRTVLKMIDFGFARYYKQGEITKVTLGSLYFIVSSSNDFTCCSSPVEANDVLLGT